MGVRRPLRVSEIKAAVREYYHLGANDLNSTERLRCVAWPRQMAMALARRHTNLSFPEIGRCFGGRDHTTVLHAVRAVEKRCLEDSKVADEWAALERDLGNLFLRHDAAHQSLFVSVRGADRASQGVVI